MKRQGQTAQGLRRSPEFRRVMILGAFCALGIFLGCFAFGGVSPETAQQLQAYLTAYGNLQNAASDGVTLLRAVAVYFRSLLWILLFRFSVAGLYLIPLVFLLQGFRLAFSAASFACCLTASPLALVVLFLLRTVVVLPVTLYFGSAAMGTAAGGSNVGAAFWRRFGVCICILFLGAILETTLVPRLFISLF